MMIGVDAAYRGQCLLAAEDNEINRIVLEHFLLESGLPFHIAVDGAKALSAFPELQPLAVLLDVSMPVMNGYEAAAEIRRREGAGGMARTPIIAMTAHALKGDREKCLAAGMDDYVAKPIAAGMLLGKIDLWINHGGRSALVG